MVYPTLLSNSACRCGNHSYLLTSFQERGCNVRQPGMTGAYSITTNWTWFVKLLLSILIPLRSNSNKPKEHQWVNTSLSTVGNRDQQSEEAPLGATQTFNNVVHAYEDLTMSLHLYVLARLGCIHARSEWIMHCGKLEQPPDLIPACGDKCFVCTGKYTNSSLPVIFQRCTGFCESSSS